MKTALISISNRKGIVSFAKKLISDGWQILATSSTSQFLRQEGISTLLVSDITKYPELLGGRVKTLHPAIHAGVLAQNTKEDLQTLSEHGILPIRLVVVNFYPFEKFISENPNATLKESLEYMDIGGPALARAAIKNTPTVSVITDTEDYDLSFEDPHIATLLASKAARYVANYDMCIAEYFQRKTSQAMSLRYGENPHQEQAFFYPDYPKHGLGNTTIHQGKQLSYNNYLDLNTAVPIVATLSNTPACAIIKHGCPCGVALASTIEESYVRAFSCDPESAFGGIICFNQQVNEFCAGKILGTQFCEVIAAPSFTDAALSKLATKPNIRVISMPIFQSTYNNQRSVFGGYLQQSADTISIQELQFPKSIAQSAKADCYLAWVVAKFTNSNAIVIVHDGRTMAISGGSTSRVRAVQYALNYAFSKNIPSGSVLASDGFFPFPDSIEQIAKFCVISYIVQPTGSIRDAEVANAINKNGMVQIPANRRHFKH